MVIDSLTSAYSASLEDKDLTQADVAKFLGIKQQQYSEYEIGKRLISMECLNKIANFYGVSLDYLVGNTDERKPYPKSYLK